MAIAMRTPGLARARTRSTPGAPARRRRRSSGNSPRHGGAPPCRRWPSCAATVSCHSGRRKFADRRGPAVPRARVPAGAAWRVHVGEAALFVEQGDAALRLVVDGAESLLAAAQFVFGRARADQRLQRGHQHRRLHRVHHVAVSTRVQAGDAGPRCGRRRPTGAPPAARRWPAGARMMRHTSKPSMSGRCTSSTTADTPSRDQRQRFAAGAGLRRAEARRPRITRAVE